MGKRIIESPIPFVLRKIFVEKISGELIIKGENFEKNLYFSEGNLCFAKTNVLHERLGEVLFKIGKINQSQFWEIHKLTSGQKIRIGQILVQNNFISQKDLFFGLIHQVRVIALSTFALTSGEWEFSAALPEIPDDFRFKIELPGLFVEGIQWFKSLPLFRSNFLKRQVRTKPVSEEIASFLKSEEIEIHRKLSDLSGGSAENAAAELKLADNLLWQKLALFFLLNIVEFLDQPAGRGPVNAAEGEGGREPNEETGELLALYERLKVKDMDYYDLLNLKNTATLDEIKEVYYHYAKKYHPDRLGGAAHPELREKANFVFARINKAFEVLSNEEKRREYDTKGYKEVQGADKSGENLIEKANLYYRKAKTLYSRQRFRETVSVMEEAIRNNPGKASYYLLLGLSQSNIPELHRFAEKSFQKVIELEPWNPEPFAALGLLFQSERLDKRAEVFFRKALAVDPEHELAKKRLAEMLGGEKKQSVFSIFQKKK